MTTKLSDVERSVVEHFIGVSEDALRTRRDQREGEMARMASLPPTALDSERILLRLPDSTEDAEATQLRTAYHQAADEYLKTGRPELQAKMVDCEKRLAVREKWLQERRDPNVLYGPHGHPMVRFR